MNYRKRAAELLEQGHYNDRPSRVLNLLLIVLISLNVVAIILGSESDFYDRHKQALWAFEVFSVLVFTIEYLARVWSAVDLEEFGDKRPILGRLRYMLTPMALIDLLAILPFYLSLYLSFDLRFLRVVRMLRLLKLTRYSPALGALLDVIQQEADALLAAFVVLLLMLVFSASGIYLLEGEIQPETFGSIPSSMWWAIVTLTTVGYGDVVPITTGGKVFAGMIGLIGIGMIAVPAAILASGFAECIHERRRKYVERIHVLLSDGILDERDRWHLEGLRRDLGLRSDEALQLIQGMLDEARQSRLSHCPHCGEHLDDEPTP
ncbi:MAG: ion transporter [Woeseiaceae bacterium]|nr:ion transporter [Woeseiaceae bacterium]